MPKEGQLKYAFCKSCKRKTSWAWTFRFFGGWKWRCLGHDA